MLSVRDVMRVAPVIPVASIEAHTDVAALAGALVRGGIPIIEITMRTPEALPAIEALRDEVPGICVGVGTAWTGPQALDAIAAGAQFVVSPGISDPVHEVCVSRDVPLLPGAQTASEIAHWVARGLTAVKFFPAEYAGGVGALKSFAAVFPGLEFCPTGGVSEANAAAYLTLPQVPCVGGSWLLDRAAIRACDWGRIETLARAATGLAPA
jgi:2-dehydro-3-deoxyphosphogluconate aldolase/(4S)-4-hydroxy-2-oxoglutarate aldolase